MAALKGPVRMNPEPLREDTLMVEADAHLYEVKRLGSEPSRRTA
jgi:hypothetical protein